MGIFGRDMILIATLAAMCAAMLTGIASGQSFNQYYQTTTGPSNFILSNGSTVAQLVLDQASASGFSSKFNYLFGTFSMEIKLVPGDSCGTVATFYMTSNSATHDEIDLEFLGNLSGQPYILQTNVFAHGVGGREQRINLWFDPTAAFHLYTIEWTQNAITILVDNIAIRQFNNVFLQTGVPYLNNQSMLAIGSLWDGDSWACHGGSIKLNWQDAPFIASYSGFNLISGCSIPNNTISSCQASKFATFSVTPKIQAHRDNQLIIVKKKYLGYNYCTDKNRYPTTPPECAYNIV
ncbi:hypothetical protein CY35_14G060700 [Sphagnum magellanicum]|nr:hypothetical protein CY35_14G060700 [Sphagnum magellanicum]